MGKFAAAGFQNKLTEVIWLGRFKLLLREAIEPWRSIWQKTLPSADEEVFFVKFIRLWCDRREATDETVVAELFAEPSDRQVDRGDAKAVEQDDG
jgi:hypothetical protein